MYITLTEFFKTQAIQKNVEGSFRIAKTKGWTIYQIKAMQESSSHKTFLGIVGGGRKSGIMAC